MNFVIIVQILITLLGSAALAYFGAAQHWISFLIGSGIMVLSFFLLGIGYGLIFKKKMIALAIGIIVFKYAILGIIIFTLAKLSWFNPLWFCIGVASFVLSAICYALKESLIEGKENGI